jgi:hypothetical protein
MFTMTSRATTILLTLAVGNSLSLGALAVGTTHADTILSIQIAVRKDKAQSLHSAIAGDTGRFSGCALLLDGQQPRSGHGYFVDHFAPVPDEGREPYVILYYHCEPAKDDHYALFSEKSALTATQNPGYILRLLFDTTKHPAGNCPTQYCYLDGAFHHTAPSRPCKYQC